MFDLIPLKSYADVYYCFLLFVTLILLMYSKKESLESSINVTFFKLGGILLFISTLLYIGFRPISGTFVDMMTYNKRYVYYQSGGELKLNRDPLFQTFTYLCSKIMSNNWYFFTCGCLYVVPLWWACKRWFKEGAFLAFLMLLGSFSFWAYGTNGIRNGIATSIFMLAISFDRKVIIYGLLYVSYSFHSSMAIPILAYLLALYFANPKYFLSFWFLSIPISLVFGGVLQGLFATMFEDDRTSYLTGEVDESQFSSTGFRWDFLLYSASAVYAGWYYIFKRNYSDKMYNIIYCTYLVANAFWIMVIKANFSNRFAYLSWFMMAIVIVYPLLKKYIINDQYKNMGFIALAYYAFTFIMNFILNKI